MRRDVHHRRVRSERMPPIKHARLPLTVPLAPIARMTGRVRAAPALPLVSPEFPVCVAAVGNKRKEFALGDRLRCNCERRQFIRLPAALVVEHEAALIVGHAHCERAAGELDVAIDIGGAT